MGAMTKTELAGKMYDAYCEAVGGVAFNGDPLPTWKEFETDPNKQKQVKGWLASAQIAKDEGLCLE